MERYLTTQEAANMLGISRAYLYDLINDGRLPVVREIPKGSIKRKVPLKIKESDVQAFLKKSAEPSVA